MLPWLILVLAVILPIALNVVLINQSILPNTSYRPDLAISLISVGVAIFMFVGLYLVAAELTPIYLSEEQLRTMLKTHPGYLIFKDDQFVYRAVNPAFASFLGKDENTILGKSDYDFFPRSDANLFRQEDEQAIQSGNPITTEHEVRSVEGVRWLEITRTPYVDDNDAVTGLLISAQDITAQKQADIPLLKQKQGLLALQDASLTLMEELNLPATLDSVLTWGLKLSGLPHGFICLVDPDDSTISFQAVTDLLKNFINEKMKPGEDIAGKVWQTGQPFVVNNYTEWSGRSKIFGDLCWARWGGCH